MLAALERHLPEATLGASPRAATSSGSTSRTGSTASDLRAEGVTFVPGTDFFCGPGGESALRLAFSFESPAAIEEGVRRLASAVRAAIVLSRAA